MYSSPVCSFLSPCITIITLWIYSHVGLYWVRNRIQETGNKMFGWNNTPQPSKIQMQANECTNKISIETGIFVFTAPFNIWRRKWTNYVHCSQILDRTWCQFLLWTWFMFNRYEFSQFSVWYFMLHRSTLCLCAVNVNSHVQLLLIMCGSGKFCYWQKRARNFRKKTGVGCCHIHDSKNLCVCMRALWKYSNVNPVSDQQSTSHVCMFSSFQNGSKYTFP